MDGWMWTIENRGGCINRQCGSSSALIVCEDISGGIKILIVVD